MEFRLTPITKQTRDRLAEMARQLRAAGGNIFADTLDEVVRSWDAEAKEPPGREEGGGD